LELGRGDCAVSVDRMSHSGGVDWMVWPLAFFSLALTILSTSGIVSGEINVARPTNRKEAPYSFWVVVLTGYFVAAGLAFIVCSLVFGF
jgi:hypothetical protein